MLKTRIVSKVSELSPEELHARELDDLRSQCENCFRNKPKTPTKDCDIKIKLVKNDSKVGWKHKHLFLVNGKCKMFEEKK